MRRGAAVVRSLRTGLLALPLTGLLLAGLVASSQPVAVARATPAGDTIPGESLLGHRCRIYDNAHTNENTVAALRSTAGIGGAACEVDAWTIADGTVVVWHDPTWGRVADPRTLPGGTAPGSSVAAATWAEVRQIRTKGGARVPTLRRMIVAAGRYGVTLNVEVRNLLTDPDRWVAAAATEAADVQYYQLANRTTCTFGQVARLAEAGATIGLKLGGPSGPCQPTTKQIGATGAAWVTADAARLTTHYVTALHRRGVKVYARGVDETNAGRLLETGADRLLVNRPLRALTWSSQARRTSKEPFMTASRARR